MGLARVFDLGPETTARSRGNEEAAARAAPLQVTAKLLSHLEEASSGSLVDMMAVLETCLEDVNKHRQKMLGDVKKMWGKASAGLMGSGIDGVPAPMTCTPAARAGVGAEM